jgi:hypothetical protein
MGRFDCNSPEHLLVQHVLPEHGPSQAFVVELQMNINMTSLVYIDNRRGIYILIKK